jgi:hypothetical protein
MCTTSVECKTVITTVLTVKSGTDPHMTSRDFGWFGISSVVRISSWNPIRVGDSLGSYQLELETHSHVVQLELEFPCSDIQLELDIRCHVVQLELEVLCHDG